MPVRQDEIGTTACAWLLARQVITKAEAAAWRVLDDSTVIWRGHDELGTGPIAALGEALIAIIRGDHPPAPAGYWWYIGTHGPGGPTTTIAMLTDPD